APGIVSLRRADACDDDLVGCQPQRQVAPVGPEQHADEALHAAKHRMMQQRWPLASAIALEISGIEAFGQHEIELDRPALPVAALAIAERKLELGAIEGALAGLRAGIEPGGARRAREHRLGSIP